MKFYPGLKGNLAVFGTLILLLLSNFFWQIQRINKSFKEHSLEHSRVLGAVVELNIRNSIMSYEGMEAIIGSYLKNSARFIAYLNQVEPFSERELAAFANESGLAGIKIFHHEKKEEVSGPRGWLPHLLCRQINALDFLPKEHLYIYTFTPQSEISSFNEQGCILVGMSSIQAEQIQDKMSVETLLNLLNHMKGIESVKFKKTENPPGAIPSQTTTLIHINGRPVSETRIPMKDKELIVRLEANYFSKRVDQLKKEFIVFLFFLVLFGCFSSWWLYRMQRHRLEQTRDFERKMARELEQSSLGRAAATITHEMRNPLNAISMGLQRIQIEAHGLDDEHRHLIISMREAVERSNSVITHLQQYVNSFELNLCQIHVAQMITPLAVLYQPQCIKNSIEMELKLDQTITVKADGNYLAQAFENLIKNAVEAQPDGGYIKIKLYKKEKTCLIQVENPCTTLSREQSKKLLAPYFTTKTDGTGLGLAISKKIIEAHSGELRIDFKHPVFSVHVVLPLDVSIPHTDSNHK